MQAFIALPLWVQLVIITVPAGVATFFLTRFSLTRDLESRSNDAVATAMIRFAGAAFVFLGAFAIVTSWQSSNATLGDIQKEFSAVTSIAQDTRAIDAPEAQAVRDNLASYANEVGAVELATAPAISWSDTAENLVYDISDSAYELSQTEYLSSDEVSSLYKDFDTFKQARNSRLSHSASLVPDAIMWVLFLMGAIMIVASGIFPSGSSRFIKWVQSSAGFAIVVLILGAVLAVQSGEATQGSYLHPVQIYLDTYEGF